MANLNFTVNYSSNFTTKQSHSWGLQANQVFYSDMAVGEQGTPKATPITKVAVRVAEAATNSADAPIVVWDEAEAKEAADFRNGLISSLESDIFEPEKKSITERYVEQWLVRKPNLAKMEIMRVFLESRKNDKRIIGILNLLAHLDPLTYHPANEMIAIGSFSHQSNEVKECALRAFEYWEDKGMAEGLKNHQLTPKWIDDYRLQIISDICGDD
ncbi:hypothetical protein JNO42_08635 [Pseudomonas putida]|uniref:hypothetical protein n=1 Tax=Pseudomonas putida TaxID=303 RepID=UPI001EF88148|nr:hypothetical protein [Pseudomonas putida]ULL07064.1 hypothetical protein JNO42_08635 [Pseudomonas putida]